MKIVCFMLGVFVVATVAESEIENIVRGRRHVSGRHHNRQEDSNSENQDVVNDGRRHHHNFKHNAGWHREGIPIPDEVNGSRFNNAREHNHNHQFAHSPEWHKRNGIPMHDQRNHHSPRPNHRNPTATSTISTTSKPFDWDIPTSARRSTVVQQDSRDIFGNTRTNTDNIDTEMINRPSRTTSTTTEQQDWNIRTSTTRSTVEQSESRDLFDIYGRTSTGRTTVEQSDSRDIFDNTRTNTEIFGTEMINLPSRRTTEQSNLNIQTSTARTPVVQSDARDIRLDNSRTGSTSTESTFFGPDEWDLRTLNVGPVGF